jgi:hypothetical protein
VGEPDDAFALLQSLDAFYLDHRKATSFSQP